MANSAKYRAYLRDLERYFKQANRNKILYPSYAGYQPWEDGYRSGYAAGKAKGIKETEEKFRD